MKINDKNFLPIFFGIQPSVEEKISTTTQATNKKSANLFVNQKGEIFHLIK